MKKVATLFAMLLLAVTTWAQSPQEISYQAVLRNTEGDLLTNADVNVIVKLQKDGADIAVDTLAGTTNENGLLTLEIAVPEDIDWADGPYFYAVNIDINGDDDFSDIITSSKILSVPYALYSGNGEEALNKGEQMAEELMKMLTAHGIGEADIASYLAELGPQKVGTDIAFAAQPSEPEFPVKSYDWDWGDGTTTDNGTRVEHHTYGAQGAYNVKVTAKSDVLAAEKTKYDFVIIGDSVIEDVDGNLYAEMKYGDQTWLVGDMKATRYVEGEDTLDITLITTLEDWLNVANDPDTAVCAWSWFDEEKDGIMLYNYGAAKKVCPAGYHLPSVTEWSELETYVKNNFTETSVTKALASRDIWTGASDKDNTPKVDPQLNNSSGFTGRPTSIRINGDATFTNDYRFSFWWTSDDNGVDKSKGIFIYYSLTSLVNTNYEYRSAFQVRCIKD